MKRKKILYWIVQLTGWSVYYLFSVVLLFSSGTYLPTVNLYIYIFLLILSAILISHIIRFIIIRRQLLSKDINKIVPVTLLIAMLAGFGLETIQWSLERTIEVDFLIGHQESMEDFKWASFLFGVSRSLILFLVWCGFYFVFGIVEKSRAQEILNLKWEASKNEVELKNLRAQLNPHFLFNSLNSIRALVELNPSQAKVSITQLSNILRRSVNLGKLRTIPLKDELELVKTYLELEKVRFEERLMFNIDVISDDALSCEIPPLMIQTLVENGIKHGISKSVEGGFIRIEAETKQHTLFLRISNSGELKKTEDENGIGIKSSRKRLSILYGEKATFDIFQLNGEVVVTINIEYA